VRVQHPNGQPLQVAAGMKKPFSTYAMERVTQKQIDFMWDYCQYHKLPYPKEDIESIGE